MKRLRAALVLGIVALALAGFLVFRSLPQQARNNAAVSRPAVAPAITAEPTSKPDPERLKEATALVEKIFSTPIEFYGRVVDQFGEPVAGAIVTYNPVDGLLSSSTSLSGKSDAMGNFEIKGLSGAGLGVGVRKEGYYFVNATNDRSLLSSAATFAYGMGPDSYRRPAPTKDKPALFVLHKMGDTVPLVYVKESARIGKNGEPITLNLQTGRPSSGDGLRVETWTDDAEGRRFNWRSRLSVPGGGLVERRGAFDFEAPATGYQESVELGANVGDESWSSQQEREYFVKLSNDRFARIKFRMIAGGNHYFVLESFLNPEPGNRNLEFDPAKVVKLP